MKTLSFVAFLMVSAVSCFAGDCHVQLQAAPVVVQQAPIVLQQQVPYLVQQPVVVQQQAPIVLQQQVPLLLQQRVVVDHAPVIVRQQQYSVRQVAPLFQTGRLRSLLNPPQVRQRVVIRSSVY